MRTPVSREYVIELKRITLDPLLRFPYIPAWVHLPTCSYMYHTHTENNKIEKENEKVVRMVEVS